MSSTTRLARVAAVAVALLTAGAPAAVAADLWTETGRSLTSVNYWQGLTFDAGARTFNFDGPAEGLWRTDPNLTRLAGKSSGIPSAVKSREGWNHVGDLSFEPGSAAPDGVNRLVVPLECYYPSASDPNTCKTGGVAVVDPATLAWRYYVKLDQIAKAMWAEVSPDGRWLWTSAGTDLVAYDARAMTTDRAGAMLPVAKRVANVLRASSVSGAAFYGDRLYLAYDRGSYIQVLSYPVDPTSGDVGTAWRLEIQRNKSSALYETEGLAIADALGGVLHWQVQPQSRLYSRVIHFVPLG